MTSTIDQVAKRAGVSRATVSRVLGNKTNVSANTRKKVVTVAKELGYFPNRSARSLKQGKTYLIAFVMADISNSFFSTMARSIMESIVEHGYDLIVYDTKYDVKREEIGLRMLDEKRVDSVILSPVNSTPAKKLVSMASAYSSRLLLVDNVVEGIDVDSVIVDNEWGAFRATEHLIKGGHRSIATITGPQDQSSGRCRLEGFLKACRTYDIQVRPEWIKYGDFTRPEGYRLLMELFEIRAPKPTAVFIANNSMAIGGLQAIRKLSLQIPNDVAVVAFDDVNSELGDLFEPPLTAVVQPADLIGKLAGQRVINRLAAQGVLDSQKIILQPTLVVRGSCGVNAVNDTTEMEVMK